MRAELDSALFIGSAMFRGTILDLDIRIFSSRPGFKVPCWYFKRVSKMCCQAKLFTSNPLYTKSKGFVTWTYLSYISVYNNNLHRMSCMEI